MMQTVLASDGASCTKSDSTVAEEFVKTDAKVRLKMLQQMERWLDKLVPNAKRVLADRVAVSEYLARDGYHNQFFSKEVSMILCKFFGIPPKNELYCFLQSTPAECRTMLAVAALHQLFLVLNVTNHSSWINLPPTCVLEGLIVGERSLWERFLELLQSDVQIQSLCKEQKVEILESQVNFPDQRLVIHHAIPDTNSLRGGTRFMAVVDSSVWTNSLAPGGSSVEVLQALKNSLQTVRNKASRATTEWIPSGILVSAFSQNEADEESTNSFLNYARKAATATGVMSYLNVNDPTGC